MARPPSASTLWSQRFGRALARVSDEQRSAYHDLMFEIACVLGQESDIHQVPNPHFRSPVRERELWCELGELLGIGDPPAKWGIVH